MCKPVDIAQQKEAFKVVSNAVIGSSDSQLNLIIVPSVEKMLALFENLCKVVLSLRTDAESVKNFFDSLMTIFKRVGRDRVRQVSEAFERAGGLDILESFQRESQNDEIITVCQNMIREFYEVSAMATEDDFINTSSNNNANSSNNQASNSAAAAQF